MTPCPLCLLGFAEPHSKEDWDLLAESATLQQRLERLLDQRGELPPGVYG